MSGREDTHIVTPSGRKLYCLLFSVCLHVCDPTGWGHRVLWAHLWVFGFHIRSGFS